MKEILTAKLKVGDIVFDMPTEDPITSVKLEVVFINTEERKIYFKLLSEKEYCPYSNADTEKYKDIRKDTYLFDWEDGDDFCWYQKG